MIPYVTASPCAAAGHGDGAGPRHGHPDGTAWWEVCPHGCSRSKFSRTETSKDLTRIEAGTPRLDPGSVLPEPPGAAVAVPAAG